MVDKKRIKFEWIVILVLAIIIIVGGILIFKNKNKNQLSTNQQNDSASVPNQKNEPEIIKKYEKLEQAYNSTLKEIETVVNEDDVNLNILKENLRQILESIKDDKAKLGLSGDSSLNNGRQTKQYEDMLNMSKEVLAERLLEEKQKNEKLTIDNRKLTINLKKSVTNFDQEKNNNVKLNAQIAQIKNQITALKDEGNASTSELKALEMQKKEIEKKLIESNKTIKDQTDQIQGLGEIIRKVNLNCYFYYEKGSPDEEAQIYLTSQGISEKYVKYFVRNKPDIYVEFKISKDFFTYDVEKYELKLYNSLNAEIYSVSKVISSETNKVIIPNKNFPAGKYSLELKAGDETLILDDRYSFKISN